MCICKETYAHMFPSMRTHAHLDWTRAHDLFITSPHLTLVPYRRSRVFGSYNGQNWKYSGNDRLTRRAADAHAYIGSTKVNSRVLCPTSCISILTLRMILDLKPPSFSIIRSKARRSFGHLGKHNGSTIGRTARNTAVWHTRVCVRTEQKSLHMSFSEALTTFCT